jgi:hypothetical protein
MAENKKGFILYADLIHTVEHLTNEQAGKLLKHTLEYVNDKHPETDDQLLKILFEPIKQQLKRDLRKFEDKKEERSEAGHLGNLKRWNKDLYKKVVSKKLTLTDALTIANNRKTSLSDKSIANVAVNDTVNVIDKDINNISIRETEFKNSLKPFLTEFDKDTLNNFYLYWTEKKPKGRKMRFEMEKTFDVKRRLTRWNNNNFNKTNKDEKRKQLTDLAKQIRNS